MDTVYRIYTEDVDRDAVVGAVSARFEGFTLHTMTGYFNGRPEKSIVIEIVVPGKIQIVDYVNQHKNGSLSLGHIAAEITRFASARHLKCALTP